MAENVGVLGIDVYFPSTHVCHSELEVHDGVSSGKYTKGLGQTSMSAFGDREDTASMALSVVSSLMREYDVDPHNVGRIDVGTETPLDASKSIKTYVCQLFEAAGNTDIEGADCVNACYGGTAALLNAVAWVQSPSWDGRLAIVVASDLALYAPGPARPTGGGGAVAMLVGPDAPLAVVPRPRASFSAHAFDFYKPVGGGPFPLVDGAGSLELYFRALDNCYTGMHKKDATFAGLKSVRHVIAHTPFSRMASKAYARMYYHDALRGHAEGDAAASLAQQFPAQADDLRGKGSGELAAAASAACVEECSAQLDSSLMVSRACGNMYAAAVWAALASLVSTHGSSLAGERMLVFSYGSGAIATMLLLEGRATKHGGDGSEALTRMQTVLRLPERLAARARRLSPEEYSAGMSEIVSRCEANAAAHSPTQPLEQIAAGAYYLDHRDELRRSVYKQKV